MRNPSFVCNLFSVLTNPPTVFISYSHDSEEHRDRVLTLAKQLRTEHEIDADLDRYHEDTPPPKGWVNWMHEGINNSDFVLCVITETYALRFRQVESPGGKGGKWEGAIITDAIYHEHNHNTKFFPVYFDDSDVAHIPFPLRQTNHYQITQPERFKALLRLLRKTPQHPKPPLSKADQIIAGDSLPRASAASPLGVPESHMEPNAEDTFVTTTAQSSAIAPSLGRAAIGAPPPTGGTRRREAVEALKQQLAAHTWVAIFGSGGSGKTQLAALTVKASQGKCVWLRMRDCSSEEAGALLDAVSPGGKANADSLTGLCQSLGQHGIIVLDDVPRIERSDPLDDQVVLLAQCCDSCGVSLISTSLYPQPSSVCSRLQPELLCEIAPPLFTDDEAREVLKASGAPDHVCEPPRVEFLNSLAERHPLLLVGIVRYLSRNNWAFSEAEVASLLAGKHAQIVAQEIRPTVQRLLADNHRDLLYRLNLIKRPFDSQLVNALCEVAPALMHPQELFQGLLGFCVQEDSNSRFAVAPPVATLGSSDLADATKRRCHVVIGDHLLAQHDFAELLIAIRQFILGASNVKACSALLAACRSLKEWKTEALLKPYAERVVSFWAYSAIPEEVSDRLRMTVRSMQLLVASKYDIEAKHLRNELLRELQRPQADRASVFMAAVVSLQAFYRTDVDAALELHRIAVENLRYRDEIFAADTDRTVFYMFCAIGDRLRTGHQLARWVNSVCGMADDMLALVRSHEHYPTWCMEISSRAWLALEKKKPGAAVWVELVETLQSCASEALRSQLDILAANLIRVTIVILSEHVGQAQEAVQIADEWLERVAEPASRLLLNEAAGRVFYRSKQYESAEPYLLRAATSDVDEYAVTRLYAQLHTMIACRSNTAAAKRAAGEAMRLSVELSQGKLNTFSAIEYARIQSECGMFFAEIRDFGSAYDSFATAARAMFSLSERGPEWKEWIVLFGHTLRYVVSVCETGLPPDEASDGGEYLPPFGGLFFTSHPQRETLYDNLKPNMLHMFLENFATHLGRFEDANRWADAGLDRVRESGPIAAFDILAWTPIVHRLLSAQYASGFDLAAEAERYAVVSKHLANEGVNPLYVVATPALEIYPQLADDAADRAGFSDVTIVASAMLSLADADEDARRERCKVLHQFALKLDRFRGNAPEWIAIAALLSTCQNEGLSAAGIVRATNDYDGPNKNTVVIGGYLLASVCDPSDVEVAARAHVVVFTYTDRLAGLFKYFHSATVEMLRSYWIEQIQNRPFRFSNPNMALADLQTVCTGTPSDRAKQLLRIVVRATGIQLDKRNSEWLRP